MNTKDSCCKMGVVREVMEGLGVSYQWPQGDTTTSETWSKKANATLGCSRSTRQGQKSLSAITEGSAETPQEYWVQSRTPVFTRADLSPEGLW